MATDTTTEKQVLCPACGKKGKRVGLTTLRALLKDEFKRELPAGGTGCDSAGDDGAGCKPLTEDTGFRFCESPRCDVVYFAEQGDLVFDKAQLRVPVGIKETAGDRPLCYCFGHSVASVKEELRTKGRSDALDDIRAKMKDPGCRCETENPSGACCLGNVAKGIKTAQDELGTGGTGRPEAPAAPGADKPMAGRGQALANFGAVVSAIMASSCCWLPLLLLAFGISGAGIASALEAYRPLFIIVTFGFLAAAFYMTYRPKRLAAGAAHACCADEPEEACCETAGTRRFSLMSLNKAMLWAATVLAVAFLFFPHYISRVMGGGETASVTASMRRAVFNIDGMTCEGCAATVAKAIRGVPGVLAVDVDFAEKKAVVGMGGDCCAPVPRSEIMAALKQAGYSATPAESWLASPGRADESKSTPVIVPGTGIDDARAACCKDDGVTRDAPSSGCCAVDKFAKASKPSACCADGREDKEPAAVLSGDAGSKARTVKADGP